jgi:hypothetical protein
MSYSKTLLSVMLAAVLSACSSGSDTPPLNTGNNNPGDTTPPPPPPPPTTLTGVFADSVIEGIGYRTDTQEGVTNENGEFEYVEGETVTFFLGDVELPPVAGGEIVTPLEVFDTEDITDRRVINLARLLQSLDQDGNPDNGLDLEGASTGAIGFALDFDVPVETFEANVNVINLVSAAGRTLVSEADALAHLRQLSIVGSWHLFDAGWDVNPQDFDSNTLVFMADGTYMSAEGTEAVDSDPGVPGIEYGTYTWNPLTSMIEVDVLFDTNSTWGLSDFSDTLTRQGSTLAFPTNDEDPEAEEDQFFVLDRTEDPENPLVGGWKAELGDDSGTVIVFVFTGNEYSHAEIQPEGPAGIPLDQVGAEFGTYTWNSVTGDFFPIPLLDRNGDWGPSDVGQSTAVVTGDTMVFTAEDGQVLTLSRVK